MAHRLKYWSFISEELFSVARGFFPLSDKREDNYIAGLSMGGFGAFKLALNKPELFAAAGSFSGVLDPRQLYLDQGQGPDWPDADSIFGSADDITGSINDLPALVKKCDTRSLPRLYQCCGKNDFLYNINQTFLHTAREAGIELTYEEDAGFDHTWDYWDLKIQSFLKWLEVDV